MIKYILKRIVIMIPILFALTFCAYGLMEIAPGDPAEMKLKAQGIIPSDDALARAREEMHLDEPFLVRYGMWLSDALRGNLGTSYKDGRPVVEIMQTATGYTAVLTITSLILSLLISFPLGMLAAEKAGRLPDTIIRAVSFVGNAVPKFLLAVLLIYFFCLRLNVFPVVAENSLQGLFLPMLALTFGMTCDFVRFIRTEMLEQLGRPYVVGAYTRGVNRRSVLIGDVLRNALINIVTHISLVFAGLLGGSVVIETIFDWPGLGKMCMDAISDRNYPVILGFVLWMSLIYMIVNLITDISYHFLDPRVREGKSI